MDHLIKKMMALSSIIKVILMANYTPDPAWQRWKKQLQEKSEFPKPFLMQLLSNTHWSMWWCDGKVLLTQNLYNSIVSFNPFQIMSVKLICLIPFLQPEQQRMVALPEGMRHFQCLSWRAFFFFPQKGPSCCIRKTLACKSISQQSSPAPCVSQFTVCRLLQQRDTSCSALLDGKEPSGEGQGGERSCHLTLLNSATYRQGRKATVKRTPVC